MKQILTALLILLSHACLAAEVNFEELTKEVFELYQEPLEFKMPIIERIAQQELVDWVCKGKCPQNYKVKGVYHEGTVYIVDTITNWDDWDKSVYVHEVVHYLQTLSGKDKWYKGKLCLKHTMLELEAYHIQNEWLKRRGKFIKPGDILELTSASAISGCQN